MSRYLIIVDRTTDWRWPREGLNLVTAEEFLSQEQKNRKQPTRIINLCRNYNYLSAGYYCSLLAEARGQLPMPTVADVLSMAKKNLYSFALPEMESILNKIINRLSDPPEEPFTLSFYFGRSSDARFKRLAAECFDVFRYPILQLEIIPGKRWKIASISPMGLHNVNDEQAHVFFDAVLAYTRARKEPGGGNKSALYNLAILYDPDEALPPSDMPALEKFIRIGQTMRIDVELITKKSYRRLPEFDALFIRTNTAIDHYTYQFSRKAEQEGMAVIDDPTSILRCTNKVYLHELLQRHHIPTPKTHIINRHNFTPDIVPEMVNDLGYPIILKIPDGSFSRGMHKAKSAEEVMQFGGELLQKSRLILAQEYIYTEYDWRVGVIRGEPIYVCQYRMSRNHWQIVNHNPDGTFKEGGFKTFAIEDAPPEVIEIATRAAKLIGDGLYGVDLKQTDKGIFVIEVNDNPSIDKGVEDKVIKDKLYTIIIEEFIRRINDRT